MSRRADLIFKKLQLTIPKNSKQELTDGGKSQMKSVRPNENDNIIGVQEDPIPKEKVLLLKTSSNLIQDSENITDTTSTTTVINCRTSNENSPSHSSQYRPIENCLPETPSRPTISEDTTILSEMSKETFESSHLIMESPCLNAIDEDICIDFNNSNNEPLIFIVGENGEMTPVESIIENNTTLSGFSNNEFDLFDGNDIGEDGALVHNSHEKQSKIGDNEKKDNLQNCDIIQENVAISEQTHIEVGLREEISQVNSVKNPINVSDANEVNDKIDGDLRDINLVEENQDEADLTPKRTRRKRHQVKEDDWEYKRAKTLREKGDQYKGRRLIDGKSKFIIEKPPKKMKSITCKCKLPTFRCSDLSENDRKQEFTKFWGMTWQEKRIYVSGLTDMDITGRARDRKVENESRRKFSYKFHININKKKMRVCRRTFLDTFDLKGWTVNNWLKEKKDDRNENSLDSDDLTESGNEVDVDKARKSGLKEKRSRPSRQEQLITRHNILKEFLLSLPTIESHYCRKSSTKLYLEPVWTSKSCIYEHYRTIWCREKNIEPLSQCSFYKTFEDLNLALFQPKKDQCDLCRAYSMKHISEEVYQSHIKRKDDAQKEKEKDKAEEENVFTIDLQSLLLCPKSNASALYYRRKLAVHNFCIFNLRSKEGYCFLWNESEGKLTSNEFSSILFDFLENQIISISNNSFSDSCKKFVIYSDGCTYQNRCATLSNALLHLAVQYKVTIEQKILEKGHTYMECDSMHSVIERHLKNKDINVPADYVTICKNARKHPKPYNVKYLDYSFFKDFSKDMNYKSIRPGNKVGDPKVTDIRCLKYSPEGKIYYKLNYQDDYEELINDTEKSVARKKSTRQSRKLGVDTEQANNVECYIFPQLYKDRQKIPREKFNHLQELKLSVPKDFHSYYDNLPTDV